MVKIIRDVSSMKYQPAVVAFKAPSGVAGYNIDINTEKTPLVMTIMRI